MGTSVRIFVLRATCRSHILFGRGALGGAATSTEVPGRLSPRELEVLRLVADGMSNRQIAEALVVAEGTVANHVHHILTKTNTATRTEASTWGMRNGLLR